MPRHGIDSEEDEETGDPRRGLILAVNVHGPIPDKSIASASTASYPDVKADSRFRASQSDESTLGGFA
jgi:hypothetical protein